MSIEWIHVPAYRAAVAKRDDGKVVLVALMKGDPGKWGALALETVNPSLNPSLGPEAILDNHAHEVVVRDVPYRDAVRAAKEYATKWLAGAAPEKCACGNIDAKLKRKRGKRMKR